uniref:PEAK family member 3 n=1 Tax=Propithecus coquereli TaxID=379532 RepID=A0A2K6EJW0_PROCO
MTSPEPAPETLEPDGPTWPAQPMYSNLGEVRAHLLPSKACRPRTPGSPSRDPQPLPPPLPKKTLIRTQSLPTHGAPTPGSARAQQPRQLLLGSHSVDETQAEAGPACPPAELTFSMPDATFSLLLRDLRSPEAVHAALAARQLEGLRVIRALLRARLMGGHPGPCCPGDSFRLLSSSPCVESGDALYYRVVRMHEETWHVLAAKSAARTRGALQALLWGPGPELRGRGAPLGPWLRARRALLVLHLAERAAGGGAPGLEDWLCCEYLAEATEALLSQALVLLWD